MADSYKALKPLLNQTFTYYEYQGIDRQHKSSYSEGIEITGVRVDKKRRYSVGSESKNVLSTHTIYTFVDVTAPFIEFKEQSKIVLDGKEYIIEDVRIVNDLFTNRVATQELNVR